jgi:hypothetical protein
VSLNSWIVEAISGRAGAGVSIVAVENAYRAESVRAFKVVFSKALGALAQATTWTKLTPYVLESNQVIELKGVSAQQMSTTELANPMRMQ